MTPEQRAEALTESQEGMEALRHIDVGRLEPLIAAAIREAVAAEWERCAKVAADFDKCKCCDADDPDGPGHKIAATIRQQGQP